METMQRRGHQQNPVDELARAEVDWERAPGFGRRSSLLSALKMLAFLHPGPVTIVETGTLRNDSPAGCTGDGWSTLAWGWYAKETGSRVFTVDINPAAIEACQRLTRPYAEHITYVTGDSVRFLSDWDLTRHGSIHLLYLDSLDYLDYAASEAHSLAEAKAALPFLAPRALVLFDDTLRADAPTAFRGKGAQSIPFLLEQGFRVAAEQEGQVLLVRGAAEGSQRAE